MGLPKTVNLKVRRASRTAYEELDVIEYVAAGFFACFVFLAPDTFAFEQVEEALDVHPISSIGILRYARVRIHSLQPSVLVLDRLHLAHQRRIHPIMPRQRLFWISPSSHYSPTESDKPLTRSGQLSDFGQPRYRVADEHQRNCCAN